jgi:hypothetical protein
MTASPSRLAAITGIDHLLVAVRDLEAARRQWRALGFTPTPRGRHIGWGTANYCLMFETGYVELLGIVDPSQFVNNLDRVLERRQGLTGLAFASTDAARTKAALAAGGFHPDGPRDLKRLLELPEGDVLPAFSLVFLPPEETPGASAFFCQQLTPELVRRPEWLRHENGAVALAGFTIACAEPAALAPVYARLFGAGAVAGDGDTLTVVTGAGDLRFVVPARLAVLYPGLSMPLPELPCPVALAVAVADLEATRAELERRGFRPTPTPSGLALPPEVATGAVVEFVPGSGA